MRPTHVRAIDGLRALAVLGVVAHHSSLLPFRIGSRGVELFFVISGFCLSLPPLQRMARGLPFEFDRARFALGRLIRIVPPYYAALALFALLSLTPFGVPTVFSAPSRFEWLLDALFLTGSRHGGSPPPAYNASFWTLGVEARWYLVFPAILAAYAASKRAFAALALGFYTVAALTGGILDLGTIPCFMLGIVAADLYVRGKAGSMWFPPAAAICFGLAVAFARADDPGQPLWHLAAFFIVLAGIGTFSRALAWKPLVATGAASYSLYLIHQPLLVWMYGRHVPLAVCIAAALAAGFLFWRLVEVPSVAGLAFLKRRRTVTASAAT